MQDYTVYKRLDSVEKELDEVLKELSKLKQNYQEVLDMLRAKNAEEKK